MSVSLVVSNLIFMNHIYIVMICPELIQFFLRTYLKSLILIFEFISIHLVRTVALSLQAPLVCLFEPPLYC